MGQQQLLLLVLATVIVGLATVAGIQAFSESQAQASQDALVQKGTSVASDIQGLYGKPTQMGGLDNVDDATGTELRKRLAYDSTDTGNDYVPAPGAGAGGECQLIVNSTGSNGQARIVCESDDATQDVTVGFDPDEDTAIQTAFGSGEQDPYN